MTGGFLNDDERKANLSFAWLSALAALAGYTCEKGPDPDVTSVDAIVRTGRPPTGLIDVQLKATSSPNVLKDGLHYQVRNPNYDHLRESPRLCPIILAILELPANAEDWSECDAEQLALRRRVWWLSLRGYPEIDGGSKVVILPESQLLNPGSLQQLMNLAVQGIPIE